MPKFGIKEKRVPTAINAMGERAFKLDSKEELVSTVLTTFLEDSYYEKQKEIVNRISKCADECSEDFVAKTALYARKEANMRSVSHLLAGYLSKRLSGKKYARNFYENICQRPDDASEILSYYSSNPHKGKLPSAMKYGFKSYLEKLKPYQIDKYKMKGRKFSLKDLASICRIKPKYEEAWRRLFNGESLEDLYESKILAKELTKVGQGKTESEKKQLKAEVFKEQLSGKMPIFALIRNLRNILEFAPDEVEEAYKQLCNDKTILNSKLLPFRFATAYTEVEAFATTKSKSILFESDFNKHIEIKKKLLLKGLEYAINVSIQNIPKLHGSTAILVDHSGSVRGDSGGGAKISAFSKTTSAMIGNLFGSMMLYSQDDVYLGLFGDRLITVKPDRTKGVLEHNLHSFNEGEKCGRSTENGLYTFLKQCVDEKIRVDNLIIFSDMVIGYGSCWDGSSTNTFGGFQNLFKEFRKINPQCKIFSIDIKQTSGTSVFDKSMNVYQIAGWSDKIFDLICGQSKGYTELIKQIEKINLFDLTSKKQ